ncbi:MAG: 4Fe-4S dicluster domain-containing protein [Gammaproteobacteria bacterium]|nr:4Fe-4S dicluster domain-containing protein [Gammaproteobacteria bacterium]
MAEAGYLARDQLQRLLDRLQDGGYRLVGPTAADGAIQYRELHDVSQLPSGLTDDQAPGSYRLSEVDSARCFAWANGPQALKPLLFQPRELLWQVRRGEDGRLAFESPAPPDRPLAVLGVRACDIAALALHDAHFTDSIEDPVYRGRREGLFIIAVHCAYPADTCFCASTGDGPRARDGFDIALHELDDGFIVETGSSRGAKIAAQLPLLAASRMQREQADSALDEAALRQFRQLPSRDLEQILFARLDHPRWQQVAQRCLACGNCTSVCPTCFCHAQSDVPALDGNSSEHIREWDSCFNAGHAQLHGFQVRPHIDQRYRQWLTHKLGSWHSQYGRSGCVGCGRCITWCPVGIDLTEEANAICATEESGETP